MADAAADEPQEDNGILGGGIHRMIMIFIATQCISNLFGPTMRFTCTRFMVVATRRPT